MNGLNELRKLIMRLKKMNFTLNFESFIDSSYPSCKITRNSVGYVFARALQVLVTG